MPDAARPDAAPPEGLYSVKEAARHLHLHYKTVEALIARGELGHVRIGRRVFVRGDQLAAFIDERTVDAEPERRAL
jgi:excisionase family DNA binding protein